MREFQNIKGVPLVVREPGTGEVSIIPYAERTDLVPEVDVDVIDEKTATYDVAGLKFPTDEEKQDALDELNAKQDEMTNTLAERRRYWDERRPFGPLAVANTISPPSRLQMHIESDKEHTDIRRTS